MTYKTEPEQIAELMAEADRLRVENERLRNIEMELHKLVGNLGGQVDRLREENERLRDIIVRYDNGAHAKEREREIERLGARVAKLEKAIRDYTRDYYL